MTAPAMHTGPAIVVGVDGSPAASHAAIWAIDEAIGRDVPLRLVAVPEWDADSGSDPSVASVQARSAVQAAAAAVRADGRPVRVQTEVVTGAPTLVLLEASRTAAMICVGALGLRHFGHHRVGSTSVALVSSAHCPVAVVRGAGRPAGWVVVELDYSPEAATVLQCGVAQARLRSAPLRVLGAWQSRSGDSHDGAAVADGNRMLGAQLDRRLSPWRHRYPDLDVAPVAVHGPALGYVAAHVADIQLVVVGARNATGVGELFGPTGLAALHDTDCSVLVVDPQRLL